MWFDDPAAERIGRDRIDELSSTRAAAIAVACPFCLTMVRDGMADIDPSRQVLDISELLDQRIHQDRRNRP